MISEESSNSQSSRYVNYSCVLDLGCSVVSAMLALRGGWSAGGGGYSVCYVLVCVLLYACACDGKQMSETLQRALSAVRGPSPGAKKLLNIPDDGEQSSSALQTSWDACLQVESVGSCHTSRNLLPAASDELLTFVTSCLC
ncbi:unnamed protein product [Leptosia nina]|uniref:Uncharacterized protein n=1 Tax=Leptosia nina TaxID=320188 RepID=A0AAV1JCK4_9NEOP